MCAFSYVSKLKVMLSASKNKTLMLSSISKVVEEKRRLEDRSWEAIVGFF